MKTMKKGDKVERVKEEDVAVRIKAGWILCPKSAWKKTVR